MIRRLLPTSLLAILGMVGSVAAVSPTAGVNQVCDPLDGRYSVDADAWEEGIAAAGVTIVSASDQEVVFVIQGAFTVTDLCVKTGNELDNFDIDTALPVHGPATVTVTRAGPGLGLGHLSFDTEATGATCESTIVEPPDLEFDQPIYIDRQRAGGEPVSVVAHDGSISVSAHAGTTHVFKDPEALAGARDFTLGYWNQTLNWRSVDGGRTWEYIGLAGQREGPHSPTSTGFSDPDFAIDQAGNIYNVEIDLVNNSVFKSPDDGQSYPFANPEVSPGDRPWLTALEENEVFLYINSLPKGMLRSTDPALLVWERLPVPPVTSKSLPDPLNPDDGLIGPVGLGGFAISGDDAQTWERFQFGGGENVGRSILGRATQFFGVLGVDNDGNIYQAAAGGYGGANDDNPNGQVTFTYHERATGASNTEVIEIPIPEGDALWPWIIAGDDGRVAVVWYQNLAGEPDEFYIFAAFTTNAHGTPCIGANGEPDRIEPQFTVVNASERVIHRGKICLSGTACNLNSSFENGDRRLGDFFTVNHDLEGNMFIASGDTMLSNPLGGPKPVANPIFIRQIGGDRMLEEPVEARPSRCLFPIPSC